jgi:hypothetical protein
MKRLLVEGQKMEETRIVDRSPTLVILLTFSWLTAATTLTGHQFRLILPMTPYALAAKVASGIRKRINVAVQLMYHKMRRFRCYAT